MNYETPKLNITFLYGTAWKEDLTENCVFNALNAGFRGVDTANQRKHYYEEGVGKALNLAYSKLGLKRENLFLQSKFTSANGQDHRKPYNENSPLKNQVQESFNSTLVHLNTDYLDSYILHGPQTSLNLTSQDWEIWESMENLCKTGKAKSIGISNVNYNQIVTLYESAKIKPSFVQNRCFAETKWDIQIRTFCLKHNIIYQGFSLLTANWNFLGGKITRPKERNIPHLLFSQEDLESQNLELSSEVLKIKKETGKEIPQIIFRFAQQKGMIPITGSRSEEHMKSDLDIGDFNLTDTQLTTIENIAFLSKPGN